MRIIYAISPDGADDIKYHKADNRGSRSLYLRKTLGADNSVTPDDVFTVDVLMNNVSPFILEHCDLYHLSTHNTNAIYLSDEADETVFIVN